VATPAFLGAPSLPSASSVTPTVRSDGTKFAVVVAHGMGQQPKFETLDAIATGLERVAGVPISTDVRLATIAGERFHRVEMQVPTCHGVREVHLYETYWAPLTEGQVTLRDVTRFLLRAGWHGIRTRTFSRWLFGAPRPFPVPPRPLVYLLLGLAVVLSLAVINAAIALVVATNVMLRDSPTWLSEGLVGDLSTVFNVLLAAAGAAGGALWLARGARLRRARPNRHALRVLLGIVALVLFLVMLSLTVAAGLAVPALFALHRTARPSTELLRDALGPAVVDAFNGAVEFGIAGVVIVAVLVIAWSIVSTLLRGRLKEQVSPESRAYEFLPKTAIAMSAVLAVGLAFELAWFVMTGRHLLGGAPASFSPLRTLAWLVLIAGSALVRTTLIQYVGDVAAYVQPHILDRFSELREEIKALVSRQLAAVYGATTVDGRFEYAKVALVGHSLGSVILYDGLNRILNDDKVSRGAHGVDLRVSERTALLLTFGSPLDKTAFVFGSQLVDEPVRNGLAATVQPLITDPTCRRFDWINLHSAWDIISGPLDYYDPPLGTSDSAFKRVDNLVDPDASTLLFAHLEYWENTRMYDMLLARIS
jgi:hypothetical protein